MDSASRYNEIGRETVAMRDETWERRKKERRKGGRRARSRRKYGG